MSGLVPVNASINQVVIYVSYSGSRECWHPHILQILVGDISPDGQHLGLGLSHQGGGCTWNTSHIIGATLDGTGTITHSPTTEGGSRYTEQVISCFLFLSDLPLSAWVAPVPLGGSESCVWFVTSSQGSGLMVGLVFLGGWWSWFEEVFSRPLHNHVSLFPSLSPPHSPNPMLGSVL